MRNVVQSLGVFRLPQLALSALAVALVAGYLVACFRKELTPGEAPWTRTLEPLASVAVAIGLLGSVVGFVGAFGGFQNGIDVQRLTAGLAKAYYTTGMGLFTSLIATVGCWLMGILVK